MRHAVQLNAFGEPHGDVAVASARGEAYGQGFVGLWGAFSMLNHSCAPNAVHWVLGDSGAMIVRAVRPLAYGDEVRCGTVRHGQGHQTFKVC